MLLKLGHGLAGQSGVISGGGGAAPSGYSEIQINMMGGGVPSSWHGVNEILIYDGVGNEIMAALTPVGEAATGFADLSAGEFTSNSTYGTDDTVGRIIDGTPDVSAAGSSVGAPEWSSDNATELVLFIKPSVPVEISKIEICANINNSYGYDPADLTMDFDGNPAVFVTSPVDRDDYFQTTNSVVYKWYRWTF